jgi:type II secretion system (T2SS) protein M
MRIPIKRAFDEKRRMVIPVAAGLALNVILYVGVVYPLTVSVRSAEQRDQAAARELSIAERDDQAARAVVQGRDRTDTALQTFYRDVLPNGLASARGMTYLRLAQLADQHHLKYQRRSAETDLNPQGALQRFRVTMALEGDYENVRQFIYQLEFGSDFVVIDSVALAQGGEPGSPLTLTLALSTYYRSEPHGA